MTQLEIDVLGTGIGGNTLHFNVSVYPNPANSQTYLQYTLPQTTTIQVELWNGLGQQLSTPVNNESQTAGNYVVPIRMEAAGNYYVKVIADGKPMWFKVENMK
ncbi:MAG: T9SS type A sorting domain-containing protein [Chitinophagales bacterium]|nr:T9SS type A sorting domain-containing protein [Chitinophagales bacterium]